MNFEKNLENLKKLNLPTDQYVVIGSGPLAVRGIREAKDIDIMVTDSLWDEMIKKYQVISNDFGVECICLENDIEIVNPKDSIFGNSVIVPKDEIFEKGDILDGIKFMSLEHLKKIKIEIGREKDLQDINLIDNFLNS